MVLKKLFSCYVLLLFLICCDSDHTKENKKINGFALGTSYSISYADLSLNENILEKEVDSIIQIINSSMSTYLPDSDISRINNGDSLVIVDKHFQKVYNTAKLVWKKTDGYFDPTVGALVNAYGFGPEPNTNAVSDEMRDEILTYTGWDKTYLTTKKTIQKTNPKLSFDFNALAKGYAVDLISDHLRSKNISSFLVEIGGEIVAQGFSPKTKKVWRIAIDDPNQSDERKFIKLISLNNTALATSGNYRKYKINKETGRRSVHSINPKTGNSFPTEVLSASVLAETCMIADAYATALMVMPFEDSMSLIESESNLEAYWIIENEDGGVEEIVSSGFPSE
tara:strand:+ start:629 stop:1642 length:1014 start_codon:yes stop_codon:yes gene_type:complete